jgi:hypothetical protein
VLQPSFIQKTAIMEISHIDNPVQKQALFAQAGNRLPLVISPAGAPVALVDWITHNSGDFEKDLYQYGGILLRGFKMDTVEDFNAFVQCFNAAPLPYMFRSSPREELKKEIRNIYRSTTYPSDRSINLHNESSYSRVWGMKIIFCCLQPALEGGATPIADSRQVLQYISPELVNKFRSKGIKYRRNLLAGLGMPWQEVFQTEDRQEVERICRKNNIDFNFTDDGLIIEWVKPAVYNHPVSGDATWFNHVLFFHKYARYEELEVAPDVLLPREYLSSETFFGDGSEITYEEYLNIKRAFEQSTISFPYQQGDILFLDNMLVAHGREPYKGDRVIATAILEPACDSDYVS